MQVPLHQSIDPAHPTAHCAWCGVPLDATAETLPGRKRCSRCGVATTYPWPTDAELEAAYDEWYRPPTGRFLGFGDAILRRTRGRLARRIDRIAPPGPVLDVGAGDGALLDALAARGREVLGLERASDRADVRAAEISEIDGRFAAIVFWHSLEHLRNPADQLARAAERLDTHGVLLVAVPNAASLQSRAFGDRWFAGDLPRHLVHVSAAALIERLREVDLTVERVSYWRGGQVLFGWVHGLVGALPPHLDLYDAIRRGEAQQQPLSRSERFAALALGVMFAPAAVLAAAGEVIAGRGGTVYIEARRG